MQVSRISVSPNQQYNRQNNTNFKSAFPVIIKVGADVQSAVPVVGETLNETFMRKAEHMLNNSLKRGISKDRDAMTDRFRKYLFNWVNDFKGRVAAFTCVDGGLKDGVLKPYFYFLTGDTIGALENYRLDHKNAVVLSQRYETANLKIAKDNYYNKGKNLVMDAFSNFHPLGYSPCALTVYFEPVRKKNGVIKDYKLMHADFKPVEDIKNPSVKLNKLA